ncbi:hypothetical protein Q0812_13585 [Brevundimonas sp. 2R-24]|uniref:DUF1579 domain-containing protein n=1 Tax=Peiella sedimenti TaxID=3061083 RepID=A0ABT8SPW6_9CAUL|nr:hypothetical protein [Caulobacteraceae bacterium XZ-24]
MAGCLFAVAVRAQQPPPLPMVHREAAHERLDFLIGQRVCNFEYIIRRARVPMAAEATGSWAPGGVWLSRTFTYEAPELGAMWGQEMFAYEAGAQTWHRYVLDNQGHRVVSQTGGWNGEALVFRGVQTNARGQEVGFETRYTPRADGGYVVEYLNLARPEAPFNIGTETCEPA